MSMIEILINKKGRSFDKGVNNHKTSKVSSVFIAHQDINAQFELFMISTDQIKP